MIEFQRTMDPHSLDVIVDDKHIGYVQWHHEREPRLLSIQPFTSFPLSDLKRIVEELEKQAEKRNK